MHRLGPLARLNIVDRCGTIEADREWAEFRDLQHGAVLSSFHYHYARLIEVLHALERMQQLLHEPDILSRHVRASAGVSNLEGIGVAQAPRGTLLHHYQVDEPREVVLELSRVQHPRRRGVSRRGITAGARDLGRGPAWKCASYKKS